MNNNLVEIDFLDRLTFEERTAFLENQRENLRTEGNEILADAKKLLRKTSKIIKTKKENKMNITQLKRKYREDLRTFGNKLAKEQKALSKVHSDYDNSRAIEAVTHTKNSNIKAYKGLIVSVKILLINAKITHASIIFNSLSVDRQLENYSKFTSYSNNLIEQLRNLLNEEIK